MVIFKLRHVSFDKNQSCLADRGTVSPRPDGEILHRQENFQKQEEVGKSNESPQGTTVVSTTHDLFCHISVQINRVHCFKSLYSCALWAETQEKEESGGVQLFCYTLNS